MRRARTATLGLAVLWASVFGLCLHNASAQDRTDEIKMTARKYVFEPNQITVKQGDRVRLIITAVDRDHGLQIEGYQVNQLLKKGSTVVIEFKADVAGTFHFKCSHFCGLGHSKMHGELIVEH